MVKPTVDARLSAGGAQQVDGDAPDNNEGDPFSGGGDGGMI